MTAKFRHQVGDMLVGLAFAAIVLVCLAVAVGLHAAKEKADSVIIQAPCIQDAVRYPEQSEDRIPGEFKDWRPDIRHCIDNHEVSLWDCIRQPGKYTHMMWRTDV